MQQRQKIMNHRIALALAATLMGQLAVLAQNWQTVDDFAPTGANAGAGGVAVDAAGGIYVVGSANGHGIVRYSADDGTNWTTRDDFVYATNINAFFNAVTIDSSGAVFAGGMAAGGGSRVGHWLVRRSTDQGASWETVDDYYVPRNMPEEGINAAVYSLASDGQGRVYGGGTMLPTGPSYPSWFVRGSNGGTNWDTKLVAFGGYTEFFQTACAGADVFATGSTDGDIGPTGIILQSTDHGATWATNFVGVTDIHRALTADSAGNLYSAGYHWINSTSVVWLVREAASGGTNWTTLDSITYQGDPSAGIDQPYASSIAVDAAGNVCATGQFIDYVVIYGTNSVTYGANWTWFTRQYAAATGQWRTTDLFSYSTNNAHGSALGAAITPSGSAFVVGYGTSDSGQQHWVVRKQADPSVQGHHAREGLAAHSHRGDHGNAGSHP